MGKSSLQTSQKNPNSSTAFNLPSTQSQTSSSEYACRPQGLHEKYVIWCSPLHRVQRFAKVIMRGVTVSVGQTHSKAVLPTLLMLLPLITELK